MVLPVALTVMLPALVMLPLMLPPPIIALLTEALAPDADTKIPVALALDIACEVASPVSASVAIWERFTLIVPAFVMPPLTLPPAAVAPMAVAEPALAVTESPATLGFVVANALPETERVLVTESVAPIVAALVIAEVICPPVGELKPPAAVIVSPSTRTVGVKNPVLPVKVSGAVPWASIIPVFAIGPVKVPFVLMFSPLTMSPGLFAGSVA
ncbi:hypothetical protein [Bradyrhizobium sp.]|uniref:hypothetical protein n=1 Tax=Bradyrhizobium sp. TaxID=376 RepID=UPI0025BC9726|nr:hypothetical protein [Bradyrhizobium sp.]